MERARWLASRNSLSVHAGEGWRRERDSNPRNRFRFSGFQDHRHRPLGHPSASTSCRDSRTFIALTDARHQSPEMQRSGRCATPSDARHSSHCNSRSAAAAVPDRAVEAKFSTSRRPGTRNSAIPFPARSLTVLRVNGRKARPIQPRCLRQDHRRAGRRGGR